MSNVKVGDYAICLVDKPASAEIETGQLVKITDVWSDEWLEYKAVNPISYMGAAWRGQDKDFKRIELTELDKLIYNIE